jgi:NADH-quinone oxidoreductase subunit J
MIEAIFFAIFGLAAIGAALSLILQKNIVYSALSLIVVIGSMGGLFLLLNATFLAVLQIVIYAGAIMALFVFVIMMVDVRDESAGPRLRSKVVLLVLFLIAGAAIWGIRAEVGSFANLSVQFDVHSLAQNLFTAYIFPFEIVSVLIISSVIGALYIAKREER